MKWDRNKWQGRSEEQVRNMEKMMDITYIAFFILLVGYFIYTAI